MNKDQIKALDELDAVCRFRIVAPTFEENEATGKVRPVKDRPPGVICEIIDRTVGGDPYAEAFQVGGDESIALDLAIANARKATKPMTPAQLAQKAELDAAVAAKDDRIAKLEAELKKLKTKSTKGSTAEPPSGASAGSPPVSNEAP